MADIQSQTRVFLSYSRRDVEFARRLAQMLAKRDYVVDYDQAAVEPDAGKGIAAEDEWWLRLQDMITAADVVLFLVSPDSAASKVCDEEIAYARAAGKRIIAALVRGIDFLSAPPRLAALNVKISFVDGRFDAALEQLAEALDQDVTWLREGARLALAAKRWTDSREAEDLLLRGADVTRAYGWAARRPAAAPAPSDIVMRFIEASNALDGRLKMIAEIEKARFVEMQRLMREFLAEELLLREAGDEDLKHRFSKQEQAAEMDAIRALLGVDSRWHSQPAAEVAVMGAGDGYGGAYKFPCCGLQVMDWYNGPSQLRADGCVEAPHQIQYQRTDRAFYSRIIRDYKQMRTAIYGDKPLF